MTFQPDQHPTFTVGCCVCLNLTGMRGAATHTLDGYSVCDLHLDYLDSLPASLDDLHSSRPTTYVRQS